MALSLVMVGLGIRVVLRFAHDEEEAERAGAKA
jgi:hypothetical protein